MSYHLSDFNFLEPVEPEPSGTPELPGMEPVDLRKLKITREKRLLIERGWAPGNGYPSRSEADAAVVTALLGAGCTDAQVRNVFESFPIGEKYRERGNGWRYLSRTIQSSPAVVEAPKPTPDEPKPEPDAAKLEYLDLEAIGRDGIPPVPWKIEGWLADRDIALVAGAGGIGKSTLVAHMGRQLAQGGAWCGIPITAPCRVMMIDEEQDEATAARLWLRLGGHHENLKVAVGQGVRLDSGIERLENDIKLYRPEVVIADSVQQLFGQADENSAGEIGQMYGALFRLRDSYEITFVLVHHRRKVQSGFQSDALEMIRGSTAHGTQASTVWYATSAGADRMNLVQAKRRGSEKLSLVVAYSSQDDRIELSGEGPVEDTETALEKASEWIVGFVRERSYATTAQIKDAGAEAKHTERSITRALEHLVKVGGLNRLKRGTYELGS